MTDSDRIKEVKKFSGLSFNKLSKELGLKTPQTFYDIIKGKHGISKELAEKIKAKYLNIDLTWLLTGEGNMIKDQSGNNNLNIRISGKSKQKISNSEISSGNKTEYSADQLLAKIDQLEEQITEYKKREEELLSDKKFLQELLLKKGS